MAAEKLEPEIKSLWDVILKPDPKKYADAVVKFGKADLGLQQTYIMLIGFAIENFLKGVLVSKDQEHFKKITLELRRLPKALQSHKLVELAEKLNLQIGDKERTLLAKLEDHLLWAGRYPVPTKPSTYEQIFEFPLRTSSLFRIRSQFDLAAIKGLVSLLQRQSGIKLNDVAG
jgi:hypothetical protein